MPCLLIEYMEYRAWGGFASYKNFIDAYNDDPWPEGFWRDE